MNQDEKSVLLFWKRKLHKMGRMGAILLLTKDDDELLRLEAKYLTVFMMAHTYLSVCIVSDKKGIIDKMSTLVSISCEYEVVTSKVLDRLYHLENAFGIFGRIYSDVSEPMVDGDFYKLIGYKNITIEDIVCFAIYSLDVVPTDKEVLQSKLWVKNSDIWKDKLANLKNIIGTFDSKPDYSHIQKQKEIIYKKEIFHNKNVYLYADSEVARWCLDIYGDCNICGIIDRDETKTGSYVGDTPIYGLSKLDFLDFSKDIVLVTNRRCEEIIINLVAMGGILFDNIFVLNLRPDIVDWEDNIIIQYIEEMLQRGYIVYNKWRRMFLFERFLLSPWKASGDIYVTGLYLRNYIEKNCHDRYKIFVTQKAAANVAKIIGYDTEILSEADMLDMLTYVRYMGFNETNSFNINYIYPNRLKNRRGTEIFRIVDFNTGHQRMIYESKDRKTRTFVKQNNSEVVFEKNNLEKSKTVIIAPYSNSSGNVPKEYCIKIVDGLSRQGYTVCTNIAGDESPIDGTIGLFLPYDIVLDFVNKCAGVIGIRSGLFDIVSSSDTKMAVYYVKTHERFFSLKNMGLKADNLLELNTTDNDWKEIVDKTLSFFDTSKQRRELNER